MERVELPETAQVRVDGHPVVAANIWEREPLDDPAGPVGLRAQIAVGEGAGADVAEGAEVTIGDGVWTVELIEEDPVNRRGRVVIVRSA